MLVGISAPARTVGLLAITDQRQYFDLRFADCRSESLGGFDGDSFLNVNREGRAPDRMVA